MGAPRFFGRGGGQDRARDLTAANTLSAFGRFNQRGGAVRFRPIQSVRSPRFRPIPSVGGGGGGGGGGGAVRFQPIQPVGALLV